MAPLPKFALFICSLFQLYTLAPALWWSARLTEHHLFTQYTHLNLHTATVRPGNTIITAAVHWVWHIFWCMVYILKTICEASGTQREVNCVAQSRVASKWESEMWRQICLQFWFGSLDSKVQIHLSYQKRMGWGGSTHSEGLCKHRKPERPSGLSCLHLTAECSPAPGIGLTLCLLPVSFLFTHSFCCFITLACIWLWLFVASTLLLGTLTVSAPFLTGSALEVFWIKFPRVRIWLALLMCFSPSHVTGHWPDCVDWLSLGQIPTTLPTSKLLEEGAVGLPRQQGLSLPLRRVSIHTTASKARILTRITCSFPGMLPYLVCLKTYLSQR